MRRVRPSLVSSGVWKEPVRVAPKGEYLDALIRSYEEWLALREPDTVLTNELDGDGKRIRLFGFMVSPWKDVRVEVARLRELQSMKGAA